MEEHIAKGGEEALKEDETKDQKGFEVFFDHLGDRRGFDWRHDRRVRMKWWRRWKKIDVP